MNNFISTKDFNEGLNKILPYIENNTEFFEKELLSFCNLYNIFKYKNKQLIGFTIKKGDNQPDFIFINDKYLQNDGNTHYNTFLFYNKKDKAWTIFFGQMSDEQKTLFYNFITKSLLRKIKIHNIIK